MKYYMLTAGSRTPVEIDRKGAVIQLEGGGCLNGKWALDHATKDAPATSKYATFWSEPEPGERGSSHLRNIASAVLLTVISFVLCAIISTVAIETGLWVLAQVAK